LMVHIGDRVEVGQPLVKLDDTRFLSAFLETQSQILVLRAAIARLESEVLEKEHIEFPEDIDPEGELARSERDLFNARRARLIQAQSSIQDEIAITQQQLNLVKPLVQRRSVSEMEVLKLQQ